MRRWKAGGMGGSEEEAKANEYPYLYTENRNLPLFLNISST